MLVITNMGILYGLQNNEIKTGETSINIEIKGSGIPSPLHISILIPGLFQEMDDYTHLSLQNDSDSSLFTGTVPMETKFSNVGFIVEDDSSTYSLGFLTLRQDSTLNIKGLFHNGKIEYDITDKIGFNNFDFNNTDRNYGIIIAEIMMRFSSYHLGLSESEPDFNAADFKNWKVVEEKLDSLFIAAKDYAFDGRSIPDSMTNWVENNLKLDFVANWVLPIQNRAKQLFNITDKIAFPSNYYSNFLNDIDYSQTFLEYTYIINQYDFLKSLLLYIPDKIPEIQDRPLNEWQTIAKPILAKYIDNPTDLLLDMLAAASYHIQIYDNIPLNSTQITNIINGFNNDLKNIIIGNNEKLKKRLEENSLLDLSDSSINLYDWLMSNYNEGRVCVDIWNTWCGVCKMAHKKFESHNITKDFPNIRFVYVSDTSSPKNSWIKDSGSLNGLSVRISRKDMETFLKIYNISGMPTYLLIKNGMLIKKPIVGFSGLEQFISDLKCLQ